MDNLRHFHAVSLVLFGEGVESLQSYRGDRSPESSQWYLNNKEDLLGAYKVAQSALLTLLQESVTAAGGLGREVKSEEGDRDEGKDKGSRDSDRDKSSKEDQK